jgi:hypothetical protein
VKPYDPNATCPKCGRDVNKTFYRFPRTLPPSYYGCAPYCPDTEHVHRACDCGYWWVEAPLDAVDRHENGETK